MSSPDPVLALRALADSTRLGVARLLLEGAFNVGELQEVLEIGQSTVSHHLKVLADAGLLSCRREGRVAWYQWEDTLSPALESLRQFVKQHAPGLKDEARQRLHQVFEARAERTRRYFDVPTAEALASERSSVVGVDVTDPLVAAVPAGATVVDLGTGAGRLLGPLKARAAHVIGIDASSRMLERAAKAARERGWEGVDLRLGTIEHLPLRDREVDAAVAHLVLHHAAQPETALSEAFRTLKPGGVLVVGDFLPHDQEWMRDELADQWLGFEPESVARMVRDVGFRNVKIDRHRGRANELGMFVLSAERPSEAVQKVPARSSGARETSTTRTASQSPRSRSRSAARGVRS
jgi:ArsR family transcriptional regulator